MKDFPKPGRQDEFDSEGGMDILRLLRQTLEIGLRPGKNK